MAGERGPPALAGVESWIFDLDNTLYRTSAAMAAQMDELINSFVRGLCGVGRAEAHRVQKAYFRRYGLTLRGLMLHHGADPGAYRRHMSALDLADIAPDPALADAVARLPGRKIIHTNMFSGHADRVLRRLGADGLFDGVFDIDAAGYVPKPAVAPYRLLCRRHGVDPRAAAMVEDIARNLEPAAALGMATVWLRGPGGGAPAGYVHHVVDDMPSWLAAVAGGAAGGGRA